MQTVQFGDMAQKLARNPLGIIALFIVLVYGVAGLVTAFGGSFSPAERLPLIYFLILFPILVLVVFAWLVSRHSARLFAPSDFRDEENYIKTLAATASLAVATAKNDREIGESKIRSVVDSVHEAVGRSRERGVGWANHVLWVDDRPDNNVDERNAFEAMGLSFALAQSTQEALDKLETQRFAVIISDMGRREGPREGYVLLDELRRRGDKTPYFIYAGSNRPEHQMEALERGAHGSTNLPHELFRMVMRAVANHRELAHT